jgi:hypothetical protein
VKLSRLCIVTLIAVTGLPLSTAHAAEPCDRVAVVTLPGVIWADIERFAPPNIIRAAEEGAVGSIAMRTNSARIRYASGFLSLGAGTRADAWGMTGSISAQHPGSLNGTLSPGEGPEFLSRVGAGRFPEIARVAEEADYRSEPGALGTALRGSHPPVAIGNGDPGLRPPSPMGQGRWVLLAAMETDGVVAHAAVGTDLLTRDPDAPYGARTDSAALARAIDVGLELPCSTLFVDQGDLLRADREGRELGGRSEAAFGRALAATDQVVGHLARALDPRSDLLLIVSPNSPRADQQVQLGVAIARGGHFEPGTALGSASTRQEGIVSLPDVAPTVLAHLEIERPTSMVGRPWIPVDTALQADQRMAAARRLNEESVFTDRTKAGISTGFVIFQIAIYLLAVFFMWRRERSGRSGVGPFGRWLQYGGLSIVAFPLATFLANPISGHRIGVAGFIAALMVIDAALVAAAAAIAKDPLERLLLLTGSTVIVLIGDLVLDGGLQLNATFGNEPIVAGRFSGLGNLAFSVLGASSVMTGALLVHRWPDRRSVSVFVAALFAATVYVDGAPNLGADVGGVIALVPALGITLLLLSGHRPSLGAYLVAVGGTLAALALFLLLDLARAPEERTHLARLFEDIRSRGGEAFLETIQRKIRTNLRVFRSTIWTYAVPPALGVMAWLLLRPTGRWHRLAVGYPRLRAGLIGGLILAVVGYAFNDSGIVIPSMVLAYLAPMSLLIHLKLEIERPQPGST